MRVASGSAPGIGEQLPVGADEVGLRRRTITISRAGTRAHCPRHEDAIASVERAHLRSATLRRTAWDTSNWRLTTLSGELGTPAAVSERATMRPSSPSAGWSESAQAAKYTEA